MENFLEEYSKFLDGSGNHLSLKSLATYINLSGLLSEKEKQFISNHLTDCKQCINSFNLIFDEDLEIDGKKNVTSLFRQLENPDDEAVMFRSEDTLVEIELTRLSQSDFNLRFLSLPSRLMHERAALKVNSEYILRVVSMDMETMYIIHSEKDLMSIDSFELVSLTAPPVIPRVYKAEGPARSRKYYWYAAAAMVIIAAVIMIYFASGSGQEFQTPDESTKVTTDLTPGQKPIRESDTAQTKVSNPKNEVPETRQQTLYEPDYFAVNTSLENFIGRNNRSNSLVDIVSPPVGAEVRMPVRFEWITAKKNVTLKFVILTNENKSAYESLINGKELTIDIKLDPGLYYWKLESSRGIEAMSKFLIR